MPIGTGTAPVGAGIAPVGAGTTSDQAGPRTGAAHARPRRARVGRWPVAVLLAVGTVAAVAGFVTGPAHAAGGGTPAALGDRRDEPFADPGDRAAVAAGRRLYAEHCAACHGERLQGQPNWKSPRPGLPLPAPPHDPSGHTWQHSDRELLAAVQQGAPGLAGPGEPPDMPGFAGVLQDHEALAVLAFIKSTWPAYVRAAQALLNPNARGFPDLPADADWTLPGECAADDASGAATPSAGRVLR